MDQYRYQQCLDEMYGLRRFGIILGLDVIGGMLEKLGNPQTDTRASTFLAPTEKAPSPRHWPISYITPATASDCTPPPIWFGSMSASASIMRKFRIDMWLTPMKP